MHSRPTQATAPCAHSPLAGATRLAWTAGLTTAVAGVEALAGWLAGSLALCADAAHLALDALALALSFGALRLAARPPSPRYPVGWVGAEPLAALGNGLALLGMGAWVAVEALARLQGGGPLDAPTMLWASAFGLLANGLCLALLHNQQHNLTLRGAFLHVVGDVANTLGVALAALLVHVTGDVRFDGWASLCIAAIIMATSLPLLRDGAALVLHRHPTPTRDEALRAELTALPGVAACQALRLLPLGSARALALVELRLVSDEVKGGPVRRAARHALAATYPQAEALIDLAWPSDGSFPKA